MPVKCSLGDNASFEELDFFIFGRRICQNFIAFFVPCIKFPVFHFGLALFGPQFFSFSSMSKSPIDDGLLMC